MTNWEKYKDKINEIIEKKHVVAVVDGKPQSCRNTKCTDCFFSTVGTPCAVKLLKWLQEEYCPFKEGELVEVSIDGTDWVLRYFCRIEENLDNENFITFAWGCRGEETKTVTKWKYCRKYGTLGGLVKEEGVEE